MYNLFYKKVIQAMSKKAIVIGAGVAGMSAAANLAYAGYDTVVIEKNNTAGGRATSFSKEGFLFDKGPSWFWMPEVVEGFFSRYGFDMHSYLKLVRLDPSYKVIFHDEVVDIPADFNKLCALFESMEPGAGHTLQRFMKDAALKYKISINGFINKPSVSMFEYAHPGLILPAMRLNLFSSFYSHARKYFRSPKLLKIMEFPVLFLGGTPKNIPAMYSLMNYADTMLGTWYPMGGYSTLSNAMEDVCKKLGVVFRYNEPVLHTQCKENKALKVETAMQQYEADVVISAADYAHTDKTLLPANLSNYDDAYWNSRELAPSALLFFIGLNRKLPNISHHNLFFEPDFYDHAETIYKRMDWPEDPLFYLCCPSVTDRSVAPDGCENLFVLIPLNAQHEPDEFTVQALYGKIVKRILSLTGVNIEEHILVKEQYTRKNFVQDYNSLKGNAYGLSNTLKQTAFLKPSVKNRKLDNFYYTGQLTVPGPGVPPSIISGKIVTDYAIKRAAKL